jgi:septum formation protein
MKLILGSASRWRRELMEQLADHFAVVAPDIDEKAIRDDDPGELVRLLAAAKSEAVQDKVNEPAVIITSDQVVVGNGMIYEKPESEAQAREWFAATHLHAHETWTAVHAINSATGQVASGLDIAKIWFDRLPPTVIDQVIEQGDWQHSGGGLNVEDPLVAPYISQREGDLDSIIGLPLKLTRELITQVGGQALLRPSVPSIDAGQPPS